MDRRRARSRGVTPIAAALAVLALGAGAGLWWAESQSSGREAEAASLSDANQIQLAAQSFRAQHGDGCPTVSLLEEEHLLDRSTSADDAWGNRFRVHCDDNSVVVTSAGPDGKSGSADDIRAPR